MRPFKTHFLTHAITALAGLAALAGTSAQAADLNAGRNKVQAMCQVCHGADGVATLAEAPNLAGQQRIYIMAQLKAYRAGSRQDAQMNIIAKSLTDADIENVAEWYSSIKVTVEAPK